MSIEFSLSDTSGILKEAKRLGFPIRWVAKTDGISGEGIAYDPEELWGALASFERNHSHHKGGTVMLEKDNPRRASPETPLSEQAA